jgi:hypothetical protein
VLTEGLSLHLIKGFKMSRIEIFLNECNYTWKVLNLIQGNLEPAKGGIFSDWEKMRISCTLLVQNSRFENWELFTSRCKVRNL